MEQSPRIETPSEAISISFLSTLENHPSYLFLQNNTKEIDMVFRSQLAKEEKFTSEANPPEPSHALSASDLLYCHHLLPFRLFSLPDKPKTVDLSDCGIRAIALVAEASSARSSSVAQEPEHVLGLLQATPPPLRSVAR